MRYLFQPTYVSQSLKITASFLLRVLYHERTDPRYALDSLLMQLTAVYDIINANERKLL